MRAPLRAAHVPATAGLLAELVPTTALPGAAPPPTARWTGVSAGAGSASACRAPAQRAVRGRCLAPLRACLQPGWFHTAAPFPIPSLFRALARRLLHSGGAAQRAPHRRAVCAAGAAGRAGQRAAGAAGARVHARAGGGGQHQGDRGGLLYVVALYAACGVGRRRWHLLGWAWHAARGRAGSGWVAGGRSGAQRSGPFPSPHKHCFLAIALLPTPAGAAYEDGRGPAGAVSRAGGRAACGAGVRAAACNAVRAPHHVLAPIYLREQESSMCIIVACPSTCPQFCRGLCLRLAAPPVNTIEQRRMSLQRSHST